MTQNRSFWRSSSQPISWHRTDEIKPNTITANNTRRKQSKLKHKTHKMLKLNKHTKTKPKPKQTFNFKNCSYVYVSLCTTVVHNTAQNSSDNFPSYSIDNYHSSDDVYWRGGGSSGSYFSWQTLKKLVGRSSPYCGDMWRRYCCITSFFRLSICALVAKI